MIEGIERVNIPSTAWWLGERRNWVGGSESSTTMGLASHGSLAELYAEKKGLRPPLVDSGVFRRGRWGEAAGAQAMREECPDWEVQRASVHVRWLKHRLACTPDGFGRRPDRPGIGVIQFKVMARSVFRRKCLNDPDGSIDGTATPLASNQIQTLTEMMLNDCAWGVLALLVNSEFDWTLRLFDIERDPALEDRILYHVDAFWRDYMDPGIMPPFEPQRDAELVRLLYPKDNGTEIDLTGDNRALALVDEWTEISSARKRLENSEKAIKTELCGKLGENTFGRLADGRRLSWKHQHRKAYPVEASDFRVLRLHDNKED